MRCDVLQGCHVSYQQSTESCVSVHIVTRLSRHRNFIFISHYNKLLLEFRKECSPTRHNHKHIYHMAGDFHYLHNLPRKDRVLIYAWDFNHNHYHTPLIQNLSWRHRVIVIAMVFVP